MTSIPILLEEGEGIPRLNEPVTMGVPLPKALVPHAADFVLRHPTNETSLPLQTTSLATWPDGSLKWVLLDFQVSLEAYRKLILQLHWEKLDVLPSPIQTIQTETSPNGLKIETGAATFFLNPDQFKPFDRILFAGEDVVVPSQSNIVLIDEADQCYEAFVKKMIIETKGDLRTTLKVEGHFKSSKQNIFSDFFSRVSFYANSALVKIEMTLLNSSAATHPGGLWDLGDPGSIFFKDLSMQLVLRRNAEIPLTLQWQNTPKTPLQTNPSKKTSGQDNALVIYQDSSGGQHWKSLNHVNRDGAVRHSFRGYQVFFNGDSIEAGLRATPSISISNGTQTLSATVQHFWQNFPKALEAKNDALTIRLFPHQYNDVFELQGGEQKTHTIFLQTTPAERENLNVEWVHHPLIARTAPQWLADSRAISHFVPENKDAESEYRQLIQVAIEGEQSFFKRREIIDEYGWRNFGELYGDHEAVGHQGSEPLVSHYNNQYDGIFGFLNQYLRSGDLRWYTLADELCRHVKDIDIYHTDADRIEYNHGLFWHTDHYIDAQTATHRCFSKEHLPFRNKAFYGGGPSSSHVYASGLLLHHYITGSLSSLDAVLELSSFVENNIRSENSLFRKVLRGARKSISLIKEIARRENLSQINPVYGLDGPGRASGNLLAVLLDAYQLTHKRDYLQKAEALICACVRPNDDIAQKDLLDIENRWMYVVFLQSLGKYLDLKVANKSRDDMWQYAVECLRHYARWMLENEYIYLERPEKLEYPNETWGAQEVRKCNVLLYASKYSDAPERKLFLEKAGYFYNEGIKQLCRFETKTRTRPIILMLLNGMMYEYCKTRT